MEQDKIKISRKDNIEYTRKKKEKKQNTYLNIRIEEQTMNDIKEISKEMQMKYAKVIRMVIKDFIDKHRIDNVIKDISE